MASQEEDTLRALYDAAIEANPADIRRRTVLDLTALAHRRLVHIVESAEEGYELYLIRCCELRIWFHGARRYLFLLAVRNYVLFVTAGLVQVCLPTHLLEHPMTFTTTYALRSQLLGVQTNSAC
jgi:hypothetical protein